MAGTTKTSSNFCADTTRGTGVAICDLGSFGTPRGGGLLEKGTLISMATISGTIMKNLIKARKLHNFPKMFDFKQTNDKNGTEKSGVGIEVPTLDGLVMLGFDWVNNPCLHAALYAMRGMDKYDGVLYFDTGVLFYKNFAETHFKGGNGGKFDVQPLELQNGNKAMKTMAEMQFTDANEFNTMFVFKTWKDLGFNLIEMPGVVDVIVEVTGTPTSASTTITVTVKTKCGGTPILSLDDEALWAVGGTQPVARTVTGVAVNQITGVYTLTLSGALGAAATFAPYLTDGTYAVAEDATGKFYAGASELGTV